MYQIEITFKKNIKDHHGQHLLHDIAEVGISGVSEVRSCQVYSVEGDLKKDDAVQIAEKLLSDPITEDFRVANPEARSNSKKENSRSVEIWLKHGVTDTVSESVHKAVRDLGFMQNLEIKTGQKFFFKGTINNNKLVQISERLLVNPIIQTYKIL